MLSLIIATLGREHSVVRFMVDSVPPTAGREIEIVIVDQNRDEALSGLPPRAAGGAPITRVRSEKGLSRARNVGLAASRGEWVAFPDDDCWYFPETMECFERCLDGWGGMDLLAGQLVGETGSPCLHRRWPKAEHDLNEDNFVWSVVSATMFVKREAFRVLGGFDERMGVGAEFGACEEIDFVRRALSAGLRGRYFPSLRVGHPDLSVIRDLRALRRNYLHARGYGFYLRKHRDGPLRVSRAVVGPLAHAVRALLVMDGYEVRRQLGSFRGRVEGLFGLARQAVI